MIPMPRFSRIGGVGDSHASSRNPKSKLGLAKAERVMADIVSSPSSGDTMLDSSQLGMVSTELSSRVAPISSAGDDGCGTANHAVTYGVAVLASV